MKSARCAIAIGLAMVGFSMASPAMSQDPNQCQSPGTVEFVGFPETRADILPSTHRQLSGLGRLAEQNSCTVVVSCVADQSDGDDWKKVRERRCVAARQAVVRFKGTGAAARTLLESIKFDRRDPSGAWQAGAVYVTLK